jgi:hypothetical protein
MEWMRSKDYSLIMCQNSHGPYLHDYCKDKKLNKRYVGKNLEDFGLKIAKEVNLRPSQLIKFRFIQEADKGNVLAIQYSACTHLQHS